MSHGRSRVKVRYPGESVEYREARDRLLAAEIELRRQIGPVAGFRGASFSQGAAAPCFACSRVLRAGARRGKERGG
jgi:hypothetical protein